LTGNYNSDSQVALFGERGTPGGVTCGSKPRFLKIIVFSPQSITQQFTYRGAELPRECRYRLKKRTRGSDLAGNYSFDSQVTLHRERGTLCGVACESVNFPMHL